MSSCVFCAIGAHELPASFVHEDDLIFAIRDNNPQAPVHVLVLPREHIASAAELTGDHADLWWRMLQVTREVTRAERIADTGYRLVVNTGRQGGQTVGHLHIHVLGGRQMTWPPG